MTFSSLKWTVLFQIISTQVGWSEHIKGGKTDVLPDNCKDLEDGTYWLKLIDSDEYPVVSIKCSNGYGILDYSHDNNIKEYFDTWSQWFPQTAGPANTVHPNWREWFLATKEDENTNFLISPDCNTCEESHYRQLHSSQTTYWMTGTVFGCFWKIKGSHNCDVSYETNDCYTCTSLSGSTFSLVDDNTTTDEYAMTGICPHSVWNSDYYTPLTHDSCTQYEGDEEDGDQKYHLKPSLGIEGEYCVCYQHTTTNYFNVESDDIPDISILETENEIESSELFDSRTRNEDDEPILLYQSNFKDGTYRITEPGVYKIMEDITFDFHSNTLHPNEDGAYVPHNEQSDDYPGAGEYRDPYFLGFFAGITIETNDVILDLNDKTLKMSDYFYYQQRWFTTIELSTQYFLPGQGIGNFGGRPAIGTNVEIKNGILGLTSHHGIHGNFNKNILISNVKVQNFETHGIQLNGFENIFLIDVEVGPTSDKVLFNGEYGHLRMLLPRYKKIAAEMEYSLATGEITEDDMKIHFYGREKGVTMREISDELELQMNLAFDYAVNDKSITDKNDPLYESFISAKKLFVNTQHNNLPNGGAQYGIFLNTFGASVFTYNLNSNFYSSSAVLENVKIHGMRHSMDEYVRLNEYGTANIMINPFNAPLNVEELFESTDYKDLTEPKYKGNIILDGVLASNKFSNSFDYLGLQIVKNDFLVNWATSDDFTSITSSDTGYANIGCNSDVMIHSGKGINGLRLDGVEKVHIRNIEVYDLVDSTPVGKETCGAYSSFCAKCDLWGGHFRQTAPMQIGFSGNMNQGININAAQEVIIDGANIYDIESKTGPAFGISIWPSCDVSLEGDIKISDLNAGTELENGLYSYDDLPNKAPEVCAVRVYYEYGSYTTSFNDAFANYDINTDSFSGHIGCLGSDTIFDLVDEDTFSDLADSTDEEAAAKGGDGAPSMNEFKSNQMNEPMQQMPRNEKAKGEKEKMMSSQSIKFNLLDKFEWFGLNVSYLFLILAGIAVLLLIIGSYYFYHSFGYIKSRIMGGYSLIKQRNTDFQTNYGTQTTHDPNLFVF